MKKKTFYFSNPSRLLSSLLKEMSKRDIERTNKQIQSIIRHKKDKVKSLYNSTSHQIIQPPIIPPRKQLNTFSEATPLSKNQEFISQKARANASKANRVFSKQPNIKVGTLKQVKRASLPEDVRVVSGKFQQYSRIVDEQSGILKRARLSKLLDAYSSEPMKPKYRMKKTYFQKFLPDKYHFYKQSAEKSIGIDSTSALRKSRSRVLSPSDSGLRRQTIAVEETLNNHHTIQLPQVASQRSRQKSRDRSLQKFTKPINGRARLKTVILQKNMDSLS